VARAFYRASLITHKDVPAGAFALFEPNGRARDFNERAAGPRGRKWPPGCEPRAVGCRFANSQLGPYSNLFDSKRRLAVPITLERGIGANTIGDESPTHFERAARRESAGNRLVATDKIAAELQNRIRRGIWISERAAKLLRI
jgi:hypothetical protein